MVRKGIATRMIKLSIFLVLAPFLQIGCQGNSFIPFSFRFRRVALQPELVCKGPSMYLQYTI